MRLTKIFKFDAAHLLPKYKGNCHNLHGHTWKLEVTVYGEPDNETGMIIDFKELKKIVEEEIISKVDHSYLNNIIDNPTSENVIRWMGEQLMKRFNNIKYLDSCPKFWNLKLWESEDSCCELKI